MDFTGSKFAKYVNKEYGFIIDYFISNDTIANAIIKFMTQYAKKCNVTDFKDTTVVKSLNNADYCPKYDKRSESALREKELNEIFNNKQVKEILSVEEIEPFINEQVKENELIQSHIVQLSKKQWTVNQYKQLNKSQKQVFCSAVQNYIKQLLSNKPGETPLPGDTTLEDLLKKYPYPYADINTMTIMEFTKKFHSKDISKIIAAHKTSFMCTYDPPNKYSYIYNPNGIQINEKYDKCVKESKDFGKHGSISTVFGFTPLYNYCKLFYSLAIDGTTQSYIFQLPVFDKSNWFVNHGLKSICILLCYTNINYIIDFFKKVELSVKQIDEQKGDQPSVCDCKTILQAMPIDIASITKLYYGNIEDFYSELNHFIGLYLGAYKIMEPYEFVYEIQNRISYVMGILLNYLINNITVFISKVNSYIAELQLPALIDNIQEYIKLLGYVYDSTGLHNNNLSFHFNIERFNRRFSTSTILGVTFRNCVEIGFLALLVYLLSKDGIIDVSTVKYKPIIMFFEKYNTIKKINKNPSDITIYTEWATALFAIDHLRRVEVHAIDSTFYNIIVLFCTTFGFDLPENLNTLSMPDQISHLIELIKLVNSSATLNLKQVEHRIVEHRIDVIINNEFILSVAPLHTDYKYVNTLQLLPDIIYNIFENPATYTRFATSTFIREDIFERNIKLYEYIVIIARILHHDPRTTNIIFDYSESGKPELNPLYIYLTTKSNYDIIELLIIVEFNKLREYKFNPQISKELLLRYFAEKDSLGISKETVSYLLDCLFPEDTIEYDNIIEILVPYLKIHGTHNKIQVIELIRKKCVMFSRIYYDFFTPYLIDNTNVNIEVLKLIFTEYVYYTYWKTPEESPIHIYLKNNANKLYEYKSEVIRTLYYYLHPSCITVLNKNIYDSQISNLLTQLSKPDDTQKQEPPAAAPAAAPAVLAGGRKYRIKSAKKYKFSY